MATAASAPVIDPGVSRFISRTHKLLINGEWIEAASGRSFPVYNPATGEVWKTGRVRGALGGYSSSPVAADGKLYLVSEEGKISVVRAGRDWDVMAVNDLGEGSFSTPALSAGRIYMRTDEALYCFGSPAVARK